MSKRTIVMILVLAVVFVGSLSAQESVVEKISGVEETTPSMFDVGIIMNYSYDDLRAQNFSAYVPTLRVQWNLLPWFGVSATAHAKGQEYLAVIVEAVLRAPLGMVEPYIATGPGYLLAFTDDIDVSGTSNFAYNIRAGLDFNLTDWFSVGPGITLLIPDVSHFFENIKTLDVQYLKEHSLIGIGAKLRF